MRAAALVAAAGAADTVESGERHLPGAVR